MKKLSLLVALALLVAFGAFAQVSLDYSVTGDAELIWGVRLDVPKGSTGVGQTHGFETKTNSSLDLTITLDPASVTKGGSGVYGEITLSGFGVAVGPGQGIKWKDSVDVVDKDGDHYNATNEPTVTSDLDDKIAKGQEKYDYTWIETGIAVSNPDVAAKIVLSDALFLQIASKPDFDANLDTIADDSWTKVDFDFKGGATLGYMSDMIDANLMTATMKNYESNIYDEYAVGADVTVKAIDMVSLGAKAYYMESISNAAYGVNPTIGETAPVVYAEINLGVTPIDMLAVNFDAAVEFIGLDGLKDDVKDGSQGMDLEMDLDIPVTVTDAITVTPRVSFGTNTTKYNEVDMQKKAQAMVDAMGGAGTIPAPSDDQAKTAYEGDLDLQLKVEMTGDLALSVTATAEDVLPHSFNKDYIEYKDVLHDGIATQEYDNMTAKVEVAGSYNYALSDATYVKPGFETTMDFKHTNNREFLYFYNEDDNSGTPDKAMEGQTDDVVNLTIYLEAGLIDNTVFTLKWVNDQIMDNSNYKGDEMGDVTFSTKISY